ncbi:MAG: hypothetical protein ACM3TN_27335 [Alphaproteobacteria bacterium]
MSLINKISAAAILLLVIYVFIDAIASSPGNSTAKYLGRARKSLVFLVLVIGLATFFGTLVVIDPAVMGKSRWSALQITLGIRDGIFPPSKSGVGIVLIDLALAYLLLSVALIGFCFSRSQKLLKAIGLIGCLLSIEVLGRAEYNFKAMFFGLVPAQASVSVTYGAAVYVLSLTMTALLLISTLDLPDQNLRE